MNERIKLLANEAGYRNIFDNDTKAKARLEKFAELIVQECADVAQKHNEFPTSSIYAVGYVVKQHFGVEE